TGKLVIAHPGPSAFGVAAELAALFADAAILHLDAPVLRVGGEAGPLGRDAEGRALPSVAAITEAILRVVTF
ncbi:MAG: hypothetical protein KC636_18620, partial [Myxococcales bacterium]|nr:hypothetical protein [Myxococcales bacterium]